MKKENEFLKEIYENKWKYKEKKEILKDKIKNLKAQVKEIQNNKMQNKENSVPEVKL